MPRQARLDAPGLFQHVLTRRLERRVIFTDKTDYQELIRYIHLNPLRAGIVKSLDSLNRYPYTGHSVLMGFFERSWQETGEVLEFFGSRDHYKKYVREGQNEAER